MVGKKSNSFMIPQVKRASYTLNSVYLCLRRVQSAIAITKSATAMLLMQ